MTGAANDIRVGADAHPSLRVDRRPEASRPDDAPLDLVWFAGGGGSSEGAKQALGKPVDYALNHNPVALAMHEANSPSFGLTLPWPPSVKHVDYRLLRTERRDIMPAEGGDWPRLAEFPLLDKTITPWSSVTATGVWLNRFYELCPPEFL